jgi:broad specificity phosphatase PhoE
MQITLVRHGKPDHDAKTWCTPRDMKTYVERYNKADVMPCEIGGELARSSANAKVIITSSLSRCIQSAACLPGVQACGNDKVFAEAHLPYLELDWPRLPPKVWRILFRAGWFLGLSANTESISSSNARAKKAASKLIELAESKGTVLLMGHGIMNILIAWHLRRRGWHGPRMLILRDFWHASVYCKDSARVE